MVFRDLVNTNLAYEAKGRIFRWWELETGLARGYRSLSYPLTVPEIIKELYWGHLVAESFSSLSVSLIVAVHYVDVLWVEAELPAIRPLILDSDVLEFRPTE